MFKEANIILVEDTLKMREGTKSGMAYWRKFLLDKVFGFDDYSKKETL